MAVGCWEVVLGGSVVGDLRSALTTSLTPRLRVRCAAAVAISIAGWVSTTLEQEMGWREIIRTLLHALEHLLRDLLICQRHGEGDECAYGFLERGLALFFDIIVVIGLHLRRILLASLLARLLVLRNDNIHILGLLEREFGEGFVLLLLVLLVLFVGFVLRGAVDAGVGEGGAAAGLLGFFQGFGRFALFFREVGFVFGHREG